VSLIHKITEFRNRTDNYFQLPSS